MCGIAGFIGEGSRDELDRMITAIKYRGPDDKGIFCEGGVGLAHARLSIIDLSPAGHQPMFNYDRSIGIIFNGEIYNFKELRDKLIEKGYKFKSNSDTEVIIYLYRDSGEACFEKMNGMFAIAIYDFRKNKLILARDRMGKKPLYWGLFGKTLIFGSELKALREHGSFEKKLNLNALNKYLLYEYVPTPQSIFENVYKLEPATYLIYESGVVRKEKYWSPDFKPISLSLDEAAGRLDQLLDESVARRMVADVPLGIFLSGGIDSSAVAYYAQKRSAKPIQTFSIGFADRSFDESEHAREVARLLGTGHHTLELSVSDALELIPRITDMLDEPLADASVIPTYLLSKFARRHVTVALGGDGGDELFAGYPTFQAGKLLSFYEHIPLSLRRSLIEPAIQALPVKNSYFSLEFKLKKFLSGLDGDREHLHQRWMGSFNKESRTKLYKPEIGGALIKHNEFEDIDKYALEASSFGYQNRMLYIYQRMYMMDCVLVKVDRASMLNSLEVRAPFLDYTVVDFVNRLPYDLKCHGMTTKYLLKQLMKNKLPARIINRRKQGFGVPLAGWLRKELKDFCNQMLSEEAINRAGLFNYDYIDELKREHFESRRDNRKELWTLITLQLWLEKWYV